MRCHLQLPHPATQLALSPAPTRSHGMAFAAPPPTTSTPINSSVASFHAPTHSNLHFPTLSHFIRNSPNPHASLPSPPPYSPAHAPTPPPPLLLLPSRTDADTDGAATAMARSSILTTTPNFNYTTSTLKTIKPSNNLQNHRHLHRIKLHIQLHLHRCPTNSTPPKLIRSNNKNAKAPKPT
nr:hypothetical protein HmN_000837000 [Hymenolepis microstoma]